MRRSPGTDADACALDLPQGRTVETEDAHQPLQLGRSFGRFFAPTGLFNAFRMKPFLPKEAQMQKVSTLTCVWENAVARNGCDQPLLINQVRLLRLIYWHVILKARTFKKRDEQVSKSWRNCVLHLFHGLRKLRMNRERSLWGAGCAQFNKFNKSGQHCAAKPLRIIDFTIIWLESLNSTTTRLYCAFCPDKRCVETDSVEVRACLESFVSGGDRKRALWQITDASFSAHVAWSLFDLVPRCVCLLWWLACVRLCVGRVGVLPGLNPEWLGLKLRFAQINGRESKAGRSHSLLLFGIYQQPEYDFLFCTMSLHIWDRTCEWNCISLCSDLSNNRLLVPRAAASVTTEMTSKKCSS